MADEDEDADQDQDADADKHQVDGDDYHDDDPHLYALP